MTANFKIQDGKIANLDKFIIVFNFQGLNEVFNQGFSYSKRKINRSNDIVGAWKIKPKK